MANIGNIVINDGKPTPVAHTFAPNGNTGTEASYVDRALGVSLGFPSINTRLTLPGKVAGASQLNKIRINLKVPRLEEVAGSTSNGFAPAPRLAYLGSFEGSFIFHERATAQERKDVRILIANLLAAPAIVDLIDNLAPAY